MKEAGIWAGAALLAVMIGILASFGATGAAAWSVAIIGLAFFGYVGWSMRTPADASWIARWVFIGFLAKLGGMYARFIALTELYEAGDAFRYFYVGTELAQQWRQGEIPPLTGMGSLGTQIVEAFTGALFAVFPPDLLGGFIIFAVIAFVGQLMLYAAFRRWAEPHQLKPYAFLIFFLPTYAFWPSSIGKDALVLCLLGTAAYFASRVLEGFQIRWLLGLAMSLTALGFIRVHMVGILVGAVLIAGLLVSASSEMSRGAFTRRLVLVGVAVIGGLLVISSMRVVIGVDITSGEERDYFASEIVRRTSERGTVASGSLVTNPGDLPAALAYVLYRPYLWEAQEFQHVLAAIETTFLAFLTLWKLPGVMRNLSKWRTNSYIVFSTVYVLAFAVAFSVVRNMGIIARQRGQVIAFFFVFLIGLGWEKRKSKAELRPVFASPQFAPDAPPGPTDETSI